MPFLNKKIMNQNNNSRRKFIGQVSCAALGYTTFRNSMINLQAINALAAANSALDPEYKALGLHQSQWWKRFFQHACAFLQQRI
jgi:hypothetical protein